MKKDGRILGNHTPFSDLNVLCVRKANSVLCGCFLPLGKRWASDDECWNRQWRGESEWIENDHGMSDHRNSENRNFDCAALLVTSRSLFLMLAHRLAQAPQLPNRHSKLKLTMWHSKVFDGVSKQGEIQRIFEK